VKAKLISGKFYTNDGELAIIRNADDLAQLVEVKIGYDAAQMFRELAEKANDVQQRLESDLRSYESELSELHQAIDELQRMSRFLLPLSNKDRLSSADREELRRLAHIIRALAS